jgi:replication factor A3
MSVVQDSHLAVGHAVEIIGKVDQNLHVKVQAATDFGTSVGKSHVTILMLISKRVGRLMGSADFNAANAVVEATHRHKTIFYDGE